MFEKVLKKIKLFCMISTIVVTLFGSLNVATATNLPYETYNYDYWNDVVYTPAAYIPGDSISGIDVGLEKDFSNPQDIYVAEDSLVYLCDTGNNQIVILNHELNEVIEIISHFTNENGEEETFNGPYGVCVTNQNYIYIADSGNYRIVILDLANNNELVSIVEEPKSELLADDFIFIPLKVSVDYANRLYVIVKGKTEGIMVFDEKGQFTGYTGTLPVTISAWQKFWKRFSTKAQRKKQALSIPTEFTGIDIDEDGFVYGTNIDNDGVQAVRRINPKGEDVIKKGTNENVGGDVIVPMRGDYAGASYICDVVVRGKGIYSILDSRRGRIFTYDHEGNLLYIFGGLGSQEGTFKSPVAIEELDDKIIVLDSLRAEILLFIKTSYGSLINEAVGLRYDGDEAIAVKVWEQVLDLDSNFELAYIGIGKAYLSAGDNETAMKYLKLGKSREYYSIAFKRYRNEILKDNAGYFLTGIVVLMVAVKVVKITRKRRQKGGFEE